MVAGAPPLPRAGEVKGPGCNYVIGSLCIFSMQVQFAEVHEFNDAREPDGGAKGNRTPDLVIANDALYQLSYRPFTCCKT